MFSSGRRYHVDVGFLESQWESGEVVDSLAFSFEGEDLLCLYSEDALSVCIRDVCNRFLLWERLIESFFYPFRNNNILLFN